MKNFLIKGYVIVFEIGRGFLVRFIERSNLVIWFVV